MISFKLVISWLAVKAFITKEIKDMEITVMKANPWTFLRFIVIGRLSRLRKNKAIWPRSIWQALHLLTL